MSGVAVLMGVGLWYTEAVAVHLFRQPDVVAKVGIRPAPLSLPCALRLQR